MKCPDPPVHSSSEGGGWAAPLVFLGAALLFVAFGWFVNILLIGLLVAALVLVAGVVTMLLLKAHRVINAAPREPLWRPQVPRSQPPAVQQPVAQPHLHFHTAEAVEAFRRAVEGR